nr:hypothetical protein BaRGS_028938 [Batillaria attramentaria]
MSSPFTGKTKTTVAERLSPMSAGSGREDSASVHGLERGDRLQLWLEEAKAVAASLKLHGEALAKFIADELRSRRAEERESRLKEQLQCGELQLKVERHQEELRRENERHQEELRRENERQQEDLRRESERQQEEIWRQREELRLKEDRQREELRLQEEETRLKLERSGASVPSPAVGTLNLKLPAFDEDKEDLDTFLGRFERVARLQKWPEDTWGARIGGQLVGRAAQVYLELTDEQVADFEQVRASHREAFQLNGSSRWKSDRNNRSTTKGSTEKSTTRDDVKVCSTALVHVESPFYCGEVHAIVMPNLTVPMILGNYAERRDGTLVPLPVLRETALVLTRAGAAKERGGMRPLKVTDSELGTVTREELVRLQQDDPSLAGTRNLAAAGTTKPSGKQGRVRFLWRKGVLQREYTGPSGTFYQICVPERLRPGLLPLSHDVPMAGHLGCKKTQDRLQPGFYWPAQASDVRRYVASCDACQRTVPRGRIGKVPLGKHPLIDEPFRRVGVDLVGPIIPALDRKNRYILVAVDYATRYPKAVPLPSIEAERVAEALWEMWTRLGVPREVLTDNGAQFASELMSEVNRLLCIRGLTTTPYHAQCNGLVERFNGTLKAMLRKLCQDRPRDWDRFVPALLFAYREVPQESLGFSPFELLYGRTVRGPLKILKEAWTQDSNEEVKTTVQYVLDLRERLEAMGELARKNLGRSAERYATEFNRMAKPRHLPVGSRVLLLLPTKRNKLEMAWQGPYEVVERAGEADYRIRVGDRIKLFHANLLKAYQERDRVHDLPPPAPRVRAHVALVVDESLEEDAPGRSDELPVPVLTPEEGPTGVSLNRELPPERREKILRGV